MQSWKEMKEGQGPATNSATDSMRNGVIQNQAPHHLPIPTITLAIFFNSDLQPWRLKSTCLSVPFDHQPWTLKSTCLSPYLRLISTALIVTGTVQPITVRSFSFT